MAEFCRYVFKKGPKKGTLCGIELCKKHAQSMPVVNYCGRNYIEESIRQRIMNINTNQANKNVIFKHFYNMKRLDPNSTEYYKNQIFVDHALSFPWSQSFDITKSISLHNEHHDVKSFLVNLRQNFDKHIFGMDHVKDEIINIVCKLITNPKSSRNNIALHGPAGVGKSKFIQVLADVLNIPLKVISLGGIKDSSFFLGHGFVYVESGPGKIIQNVIDSKISNPIIYFDELDKVSETDNGKDIYSFLTYLTDNTQNCEFTDHYFYGMKFDLSRVFYVFTLNDITKVDKILLDRLNIIYVGSPTKQEICNILENYCVPEIIHNIGMQIPVHLSRSQIQEVIHTFGSLIDIRFSSGVREYYRILEKILMEVNKDILMDVYDSNTNDSLLIPPHRFSKYLKNISQQHQDDSRIPSYMYI